MGKSLTSGIITQSNNSKYDQVSLSYFARMSVQPSVEMKKVIDTFFVKNKKTINGNIITGKQLINKGDVIYLPFISNSNDAFVNIVKNAHHGSIGGVGLIHEPNWSWINPLGTGWVDTNYNPFLHGVNHKLNDAGIAVYVGNSPNQIGATSEAIISCFQSTTIRSLITQSSTVGNMAGTINDGTADNTANIPFLNGLFNVNRISSASKTFLNQNISKSTFSRTSTGLPNNTFKLFKYDAGSLTYTKGISFVYIGASLSDDEFTALNQIVNECLKESLYVKYGADNWGVKMAKSYFDTLHNFEPYEAWEIYEFIKRHQPTLYKTNYELIKNSGAPNQSNFIDSNSDGLADEWSGLLSVNNQKSIVTGNGFSSKAQRYQLDTANTDGLYTTGVFNDGCTYKISFKYRSSKKIAVYPFGVTNGATILNANTGDAVYYEFTKTCIKSEGQLRVYLHSSFDTLEIGDWFEISEVSVVDITTYKTPELSVNSGGLLTDWVDTNADGCADSWGSGYGLETYSIVTGNGFTGNAQRVVASTSTNNCIRLTGTTAFVLGRSYKISFKYRCSSNLTLYIGSGEVYDSLPINTGNALYYEKIVTPTVSSAIPGFFIAANNWFEIDEVSIREITPEDNIVTFNKCLNSGFGLDTDWVDTNSDGLADSWEEIYGNTQKTIVTGNGFTKRAQRVQKINSSGHIALSPVVSSLSTLVIGQNYTVYFKYRSNVAIYPFGSNATIPANTGNAIVASITFRAGDTRAYFRALTINVGDWFEVSEVLVIASNNAQFYYNFFGPNGLNKTVADYIIQYKAGGTLGANNYGKTGATLIWNQDNAINVSNNMQAYSRGANLGIISVVATDSWDNLTYLNLGQTTNHVNSFYGNFPMLEKIRSVNNPLSYLFISSNRIKMNFSSNTTRILSFVFSNITFPGYYKNNINNLLGKGQNSITGYFSINSLSSASIVQGDITQLTNEFNSSRGILVYGSDTIQLTVSGSLRNLVYAGSYTTIYFNNTNVNRGISFWHNSMEVLSLYNNLMDSAAIEEQMQVIDAAYTPTSLPKINTTINLSGPRMGIATAQTLAYRDSLLAKFASAGFTITIVLNI